MKAKAAYKIEVMANKKPGEYPLQARVRDMRHKEEVILLGAKTVKDLLKQVADWIGTDVK